MFGFWRCAKILELSKHLAKTKTGWAQRNDKVRGWFIEIVRVDSEFKKYNDLKNPSLDDQKAIIKHFTRKLLLGRGPINSFFRRRRHLLGGGPRNCQEPDRPDDQSLSKRKRSPLNCKKFL